MMDMDRVPRDYRCELIAGIVHEKLPARTLHGRTVGRLLRAKFEQGIEGRVGQVRSGETAYVLDQDTDNERSADIAVVGKGDIEAVGSGSSAPLLVVDVTTKSADKRDSDAMAMPYLAVGVAEVWWVRPLDNVVFRTTQNGDATKLRRSDTLTSALLPRFELPLLSLFGERFDGR